MKFLISWKFSQVIFCQAIKETKLFLVKKEDKNEFATKSVGIIVTIVFT